MTDLVLLDTNILISLINKDAIHHDKAAKILEKLIDEDKYGAINSYIMNELHYFYIKTDNKVNALKAVQTVLSSSNIKYRDIELTKDDLLKISKLSIKYNLKTFDAYHLYYCKKLGIKTIATFDEDFNKVKSMRVLS